MNKKLLFGLTTVALLLFSSISFSQTLSFGETLPPFAVYTGLGAVTAEGEVIGDAGSHNGSVSGPGFGVGYCCTTHRTGFTTYDAKTDLLRLYIHLSDVFVTFPNSHFPAFGGGETIFPGVYSIPAAGSLGGTIILDGQNDEDAFFILKFDGAFTVGESVEVKLINGTRAANVFWIAEGAIEVGANAVIKGALFSHPGAITLGPNVDVEGRLLSTEGAIFIGAGGSVYIPQGESTIPIKCTGSCSPNPIVDVLGGLDQYALFTSYGAVENAATSGIIGNIGTNNGGITGFSTSTHIGFVKIPGEETALAKLELDSAYAQLMAIENTELGHAATFGSGETVFPGVYFIGGAGSLSGTITLDAQNNPNAIFVFKFGAAFSVAEQSKVIFKDGTRRCNVFWIAENAIDIGTFSHMKGTFIAHAGSINMYANGNLEGRLLSMDGAIGFSTGVVYNDTLCFEPLIVDAHDDEGCFVDFPTLTSTVTVDSTNQNVIWYDAETGGNIVNSPTLEGIGTVTYWARAYNGAFFSDNIDSSTLTIVDCNLVVDAMDDTYIPIQEVDQITVFDNLVTTNDTLDAIPVTGDNSVVTPVTDGPLSIDADGELTLEANALPGTYTIIYQLCQFGSGATNCDTATVTVIVSIIDAVDDATVAVNGLTGGNTSVLTDNDTITIDEEKIVVIGSAPGNVIITGLNVPDGFTLNPDGTVAIPENTPAGEYIVVYQICEVDNPINCDSATATIVVSAPVIDAVEDITAEVNGLTGGDTEPLTDNDTLNDVLVEIGIGSGDVTLTGTTVPTGFTLNPNGTVTVPANTPAGDYEVIYQICEVNNPTNCDSATATIVVSAPVIDAVDDGTVALNGLTGGNTTALTDNDTLNGDVVEIGTAPGNVILTGTTVPDGFTLNPNGTVTVPANTPAGDYEVIYQICEVNNPTNCDSATATIVVSAPVIDAVIDTVGPIDGATGGDTTSLTDNDTLNGNQVEIGTQPGNVILTGTTVPLGFTLNPNGTVTIPANTPAGSYLVEYKICEVSNPTNCDSVTSTIVVSAPRIDAVVDITNPINGLIGGNTLPLTDNDTLNGVLVVIGTQPGDVTLSGLSVPLGLTLNTNGTVTIAPNTPAGTYLVEYQICDANNSTNCDSVTSTIVVSAPDIEALVDTLGPINGTEGEDTTSLTNNDTLNGNQVVIGTDPGNVTLTGISVPAGLTLNGDGTVTIAPNTPAGTYLVEYQICEVNNPGNCDSVTSIIEVEAPFIEAVEDTLGPIDGATGGTNIVNVLTNDILNDSPVAINDVNLTTVTTDPEGVLTLNTDGSVDVAENTPTGTYTLTYQICEKSNPTNCSQAEVVVEVIRELPDFTQTIEINALGFPDTDPKEFIVKISEINDVPSSGQVVFNITKQSAFSISYDPAMSSHSVGIGGSVNNDVWEITDNGFSITMTLKAGAIIGANTFSTIGFTIERKEDVPTQTTQPITVTIVNGSGLDNYNNNNTYNTIVKAE
jgi:hypothetical protein